MLNSSSNFPSHTHTLAFTLNSGCVVSTSCQSSRECFNNSSVFITSLAVSLQDGPGQPCAHTSLSSVHSDARASRLLPPPPAVGVGYVPKIPHAPHLLAEVGDVADDLASALFFPLWAGVTRAQLSLVKERENHRRNIRKRRRGAETCSRQTSTDQKPVKSLFSL